MIVRQLVKGWSSDYVDYIYLMEPRGKHTSTKRKNVGGRVGLAMGP